MTCQAAHAAGIPVSLCGEVAGYIRGRHAAAGAGRAGVQRAAARRAIGQGRRAPPIA